MRRKPVALQRRRQRSSKPTSTLCRRACASLVFYQLAIQPAISRPFTAPVRSAAGGPETDSEPEEIAETPLSPLERARIALAAPDVDKAELVCLPSGVLGTPADQLPSKRVHELSNGAPLRNCFGQGLV
jgi:hypothetical protein